MTVLSFYTKNKMNFKLFKNMQDPFKEDVKLAHHYGLRG